MAAGPIVLGLVTLAGVGIALAASSSSSAAPSPSPVPVPPTKPVTSGGGVSTPVGGGWHGTSTHGSSTSTPAAPTDPCAGGVINDAQANALYQKMLSSSTDTIKSGEAATLVSRLRFLGGSCGTLADTVQSQIDQYNALLGSEPPGTYTGGSTSVGQSMMSRWIPARWPSQHVSPRGVYA